ncbi:hypothetical protein, partial [Enterococcus faecium]
FVTITNDLMQTFLAQVTISNKYKKLFFELVPCDSELNGRLTTSFLNGVQKLASAVISPTKLKTLRNCFYLAVLIT